MEDKYNEWRQRLYDSMSLPKDGKISAFAESENVSTEWVRQVFNGSQEDIEMLERAVLFLEKWNEKKAERIKKRRLQFVERASQSPALAF